MQDLKVSLVQTHQFWEDKQRNFEHFENILSGLEPTDILIFPEMFHTGFTMNAKEMSEPMGGEGIQWLTAQAKKWKTAVVASLIIEEDDHYFNRMVFIEPTGQIHTYNKRKLFTLAKEDKHYTKVQKTPLYVIKAGISYFKYATIYVFLNNAEIQLIL